jgi:hypothetical protein
LNTPYEHTDEAAASIGNNYGTLSSDYDAGYDDGRADALAEHANTGPDRPAVVVCVRDPDASNEYEVFGANEPTIIDIDCGYSDLSDPEEFAGWKGAQEGAAADLRKRGDEAALQAADYIEQVIANYERDDEDWRRAVAEAEAGL